MADGPNPLPPATVPVLDGNNALTLPWRRALQNVGQAASGGITQLTGDVSAVGPGVAAATITPTGVAPGTYTNADLTIGADGRVTHAEDGDAPTSGTDPLTYAALSVLDGALTVSAAYKLARARTFTYTGDVAGGPTSFDGTANVSTALTLPNIVSAATNTKITYNAKGQVTAGTAAILASADYANQGTTTTLLHGNAAGNPSFGQVVTGDIAAAAVTFAKLQNFATSTLLGRTTAGAGPPDMITLDPSLVMSAGVIGLANTAVTPGSYTNTNLTVDAQGRITAAASGSGGSGTVTHTAGALTSGQLIVGNGAADIKVGNLSGDVTTSGTTVTTIKTDVALTGNPTTTTQSAGNNSARIATTAFTAAAISNALANPGPSLAVPGTIPDLIIWVESDTLSMSPAANVSFIQNKVPWYSAASYSATTGAGASISATTLNGFPVLSFPGSSAGRYNNLTGFISAFSSGSTIFVVFNPSSFAAVGTFVAGGGTSLQFRIETSGKISLVKTGTATIGTDTTVLSTGTWYQANATYKPSTGAYAFRVGQAASSSGTNILALGTVANNSLGYNSSSNTEDYNGLLVAVIAYSRVLSPTEIASVEAYLHTKYGV